MSNNNGKLNEGMFSKENILETLQPKPRRSPRLGNNTEPVTSTSEVWSGTKHSLQAVGDTPCGLLP